MDNRDNRFDDQSQNFVIIGEVYDPEETTQEAKDTVAEPIEPAAETAADPIAETQAEQIAETQAEQIAETQADPAANEEPVRPNFVPRAVYDQDDYTVHQDTPTYTRPQKKKEPKYITRKAFVISMILCMLATSALTVGGYTLATQMGLSGTTKRVSATNYTLAKATGSEKSIEEIVAMNENAVVEIRTESVAMDIWMQNYVTEGAGSGVIIDTKGYILTCNHVIEGASKVNITLKDGTELAAEVVGTDPQNDLAVLKVNASNLTAASYGDCDELSVGDLAVAIGNPLGELGGTASQGIISALDRELTIENQTLTLLQTDASINPGNSGGGLFDQYGNLIGIVVAKSSGSDVEGLGFAIPINTAAEIAKDLIENGKVTSRAAIGVAIVDITDAEAAMQYGVRHTGVYIQEVTSKKAQKAGLQPGDMFYYLEDVLIETSADLTGALAKYKPGDKVNITVIRGNQTVDMEVELVEPAS